MSSFNLMKTVLKPLIMINVMVIRNNDVIDHTFIKRLKATQVDQLTYITAKYFVVFVIKLPFQSYVDRCIDSQVYRLIGIQTNRYIDSQVHRFISTQTHRYTDQQNIQVYRILGTQNHRYIDSQVYRLIGTQNHRHKYIGRHTVVDHHVNQITVNN